MLKGIGLSFTSEKFATKSFMSNNETRPIVAGQVFQTLARIIRGDDFAPSVYDDLLFQNCQLANYYRYVI